jgi:hypothetical protein
LIGATAETGATRATVAADIGGDFPGFTND